MLSRAMAEDGVGRDQERCVRMAAEGTSARAETADGGGRAQPWAAVSRKCLMFPSCPGRRPLVCFTSMTRIGRASGECRIRKARIRVGPVWGCHLREVRMKETDRMRSDRIQLLVQAVARVEIFDGLLQESYRPSAGIASGAPGTGGYHDTL